ncbi:MAG: hypothetical protein ACFFD4_06400 [Candidatus Odinarchaeota archaeon]
MTENNTRSPFLQIKIDYISFMVQIYKLMAYEEHTTGILFALLMESDYLTQEQLEVLTGYSKSTISEVLSHLQNIIGEFPILQTRKPGDRKKYYYCPSSLEQYAKSGFLSAVKASKASVDFIPPLLARLEALGPKTPAILHVKHILSYTFRTTHYYHSVGSSAGEILDKLFEDSDFTPDFQTLLARARESLPGFDPLHVEGDSLEKIKEEFVNKLLKLSSEMMGGKEELIKLFLVLYLEHKPVTQEDLMELTHYGRAKVSQALNTVLELKVVQMVKKPRDRKKYYEMAMPFENYASGKLTRTKQYYAQIQSMLKKRIIPELSKIHVKNEEDEAEKERLESYFQENVRAYQIFDKFATLIHSAVQEEVNQIF